jgi:hypothetical protein
VHVENRAAVDGIGSQHVSFESMEFVSGRAFSIGNEANATAVSKSWEMFEGQRSLIVEKIPWKFIAPELANLPPVASDWKKKEGPLMARTQLRLPRREQARAAVKPIQMAQASALKPGYQGNTSSSCRALVLGGLEVIFICSIPGLKTQGD